MTYREYRSQAEMREHGWMVEPETRICKKCGSEIQWATSKNGKKLTLDCNSTVPHFKNCSNGGAPLQPRQSSSPAEPTLRNHNIPSNEIASLRESMDELAQAVRALCSLLRERKAAK